MRDVGAPSVVAEGFCAKHCALPKRPLFRLPCTQSKLGCLRTFAAEARKSTFHRSDSLKALPRLMSICWKRGPRNTPRPRLPKRSSAMAADGDAGFSTSEFVVDGQVLVLPLG